MGSHSVTCYPTQVNKPRLNPSHAEQYSIYLPRRDGRLSWPSWLDSAQAGSRTRDLLITSPTLNQCNHQDNPGSMLVSESKCVCVWPYSYRSCAIWRWSSCYDYRQVVTSSRSLRKWCWTFVVINLVACECKLLVIFIQLYLHMNQLTHRNRSSAPLPRPWRRCQYGHGQPKDPDLRRHCPSSTVAVSCWLHLPIIQVTSPLSGA